MTEDLKLTDVQNIMQFRLSEKSANNAFKHLLEKAGNYSRSEDFYSDCAITEKVYMDENYFNHWKLPDGTFVESAVGVQVPKTAVFCKKKNGEYKYRVFLPNAYTSAKSVVGNAIDKSLSLKGVDGKFKGKSALQKELKEIAATKREPWLTAKSNCISLTLVWKDLNDAQKESITDYLFPIIKPELAKAKI